MHSCVQAGGDFEHTLLDVECPRHVTVAPGLEQLPTELWKERPQAAYQRALAVQRGVGKWPLQKEVLQATRGSEK